MYRTICSQYCPAHRTETCFYCLMNRTIIEETQDREVKSLIEFSKFKNCDKLFIITMDEEKVIAKNNIIVLHLRSFFIR